MIGGCYETRANQKSREQLQTWKCEVDIMYATWKYDIQVGVPILWDKHGKCAKQQHGKHMAKDGSRLVQTDDTDGQIITTIPTKKENTSLSQIPISLICYLGSY